MAQYKITRELNLMFVAQGRLQVGSFRFILRGNSDRVLHNAWQGIVHEAANNIVCCYDNMRDAPAGVTNATLVLDNYTDVARGLEEYYSAPDRELSVHHISIKPNQASLLWFVNGRVSGGILHTDRRSLYGKSLYVSAEPVATASEDVVHVPMDPQHDVDDRHFGDDWYSLHEGPGASITVMQEK